MSTVPDDPSQVLCPHCQSSTSAQPAAGGMLKCRQCHEWFPPPTTPPIQPAALDTHALRLRAIRSRTNYGALRGVTNGCSWAAQIAFLFTAFAILGMIYAETNPYRWLLFAAATFYWMIGAIVIEAARQGALLVVDIVDTLLHISSRLDEFAAKPRVVG